MMYKRLLHVADTIGENKRLGVEEGNFYFPLSFMHFMLYIFVWL